MKFPPILLVLGLFSDVRAIPMPFPLPVNFSYGICGIDPTGIPALLDADVLYGMCQVLSTLYYLPKNDE